MTKMSPRLFPILALAVAAAAPSLPRAGTSAVDPRQLLHAMARAVEGVRDYTMTLISQE